MNPVPSPQIHDPEKVSGVRRLLCVSYPGCLKVAYEQKWAGFTCAFCNAYQELDRDSMRNDVECMASLWNAATWRKTKLVTD